ncbi:NAD(P)H-binding protein [Thalassomonas viridans]|uniref:NAD(P)H-binding protein n=1 Tax=Thalassomonas viridans TaxID=137584 RepID=A0AAE9YZG8_9GAMM|nr:NAD(P)H-binding protein [Thalassomonas viridans]WDE03249.1 NAD(P)H-binding protein [Thalassomonas viridans]
MTTAMILGASGLTGQALLARLISDEDIRQIVLLVRKPLNITHAKIRQHQVDFDNINQYQTLFAVDLVFCCLGTTIKTAGSKLAFKAVDITLVSRCAQLSSKARVRKFIVISAVGADSGSVNFYSRCKGEMEDRLKALSSTSAIELVICRPSLLLGKRTHLRPAEALTGILMQYLTILFHGPLKKYHPISAEQLAGAMVNISRQNTGPIATLSSPELIALSGQ